MSSRGCKSEKELVSPAIARAVDEALGEWFAVHQRDLNFRKTRDAYAVMVSEFMLQQTTVATVEAYFARFMVLFPNVEALAAAGEEEVLGAWAGLGYYRRARQLQAAARAIVELHGGVTPRDAGALEKLPGIGRYTAGAIASTAYDEPAAILEANTVRVFSRLTGSAGMVGDSAFMRRLWQVAGEFVAQAESPGRFNVAAMELGALVCRPKPVCGECPVREHCVAYRMAMQETIPTVRPRRETVELAVVGFVVSDSNGGFLVRQIARGEWHEGMWEFPTARVDGGGVGSGGDDDGGLRFARVAAERFGLDLDGLAYLTKLRYQVTHHRVTLSVFRGMVGEAGVIGADLGDSFAFLSLEQISSLPMGSAQKKLLKVLEEMETS